MSSVLLDGNPFPIKGDLPRVGEEAPDFTFVKSDLSEATLVDDYENVVKVLIAVPSLETRVCKSEARRFNEALGTRKDVIGIIVSKDLPFSMRRICETEGIENVIVGSDYRYSDFINEYGTEILSGPFKGLSARAVFVVDKKNVIRYVELVPSIGDEPQYEKILSAVDKLL